MTHCGFFEKNAKEGELNFRLRGVRGVMNTHFYFKINHEIIRP